VVLIYVLAPLYWRLLTAGVAQLCIEYDGKEGIGEVSCEAAKRQITSAVGTLSGVQSKVSSGKKLSTAEQKVADDVSKVLGKGAGTDSKVLGALIDTGNKMLDRLNSNMPAEFGGDHASRFAETPGNQLTLYSGFFRQTPIGQAQITAHESHHHIGGIDIELHYGDERISAYGYPAAVRRAEILKNPMRSLRIPDPTTYALGFQDEILP
jgi:hypothetical protein